MPVWVGLPRLRRGAAAGRRWPPWWLFLCITALARYAQAPPTRITDLTDIEHFCITELYRSALYHSRNDLDLVKGLKRLGQALHAPKLPRSAGIPDSLTTSTAARRVAFARFASLRSINDSGRGLRPRTTSSARSRTSIAARTDTRAKWKDTRSSYPRRIHLCILWVPRESGDRQL